MRAGIVEGYFTPTVARQAAYVTAHLPPTQSAALLGEVGNMQPSPSTLERLPKSLSQRWEAHRQAWETKLPGLSQSRLCANVGAVCNRDGA
jgi:hypothetical protein